MFTLEFANKPEKDLSVTYHRKMGRFAKSVRLMTGSMVLKPFENLSDESTVEADTG